MRSAFGCQAKQTATPEVVIIAASNHLITFPRVGTEEKTSVGHVADGPLLYDSVIHATPPETLLRYSYVITVSIE